MSVCDPNLTQSNPRSISRSDLVVLYTYNILKETNWSDEQIKDFVSNMSVGEVSGLKTEDPHTEESK